MSSKDIYVVMVDNYDSGSDRPHKAFEDRDMAEEYAKQARMGASQDYLVSHDNYYVQSCSLIIESENK